MLDILLEVSTASNSDVFSSRLTLQKLFFFVDFELFPFRARERLDRLIHDGQDRRRHVLRV